MLFTSRNENVGDRTNRGKQQKVSECVEEERGNYRACMKEQRVEIGLVLLFLNKNR